jgi:UDP-N-acetylglucosamine--N-acetylmuramyl-(pentapeptide) pyrophosphoryl-undecaprenol N-acetylglucosamine transferase
VHGTTPLRCLIAAGGTAGHVLPALAVADALRERGVAVTFAGTPGRAEARLVPEAGYELDTFLVAGIPRRVGVSTLRALALAVRAPLVGRRILDRRRPDVVLGGGGYVAGPMVLAAWTKRVPAALTEADAHLGLANRLAGPFAERVFLAFPLERRQPPKYRLVGRPIPARARPVAQAEARARFGLPSDGRVVLVFGGSQGARALNDHVVERFGRNGPPILHLSGERDYESLRLRIERPTYKLLPFTDDFGAALSAADVVVARAGGSVWEVAAAAKPAILVPYPYGTADHQLKNARYFERGGGAIVLPESQLDRLEALVHELLHDERRLAAMVAAMRALARPEAAAVVAEELIELARAARR